MCKIAILLVIATVSHLIYGQQQSSLNDFESNRLSKFDNFANFEIYCFRGTLRTISNTWLTTKFRIDIRNDDFDLFIDENPEIVAKQIESLVSSWLMAYFVETKTKLVNIRPFNQTCIGIRTKQPYRIILQWTKFDLWRILVLIAALMLFHYSRKLKNYETFYYISGTSIGIIAFLLILIFLFSRMIPKKSLMLSCLIGGWSIFLYVLERWYSNLKSRLSEYYTVIAWYTLVTGTISFLVCYRYGPVTNDRSRTIVEWLMKLCSFVLIYVSTTVDEVAYCMIVILLAMSSGTVRKTVRSLSRMVRGRFTRTAKRPQRFLTPEEYEQQTREETERALRELRDFCKSSECKPWSLARSLSNVERFSSFVEGESHLSDTEVRDYENSLLDITDDDDSDGGDGGDVGDGDGDGDGYNNGNNYDSDHDGDDSANERNGNRNEDRQNRYNRLVDPDDADNEDNGYDEQIFIRENGQSSSNDLEEYDT